MTSPSLEQVERALATVNDPEIRKPITELGMVDAVDVADSGEVATRDFLRSELRNVVEELNEDEEEDSPDEAS